VTSPNPSCRRGIITTACTQSFPLLQEGYPPFVPLLQEGLGEVTHTRYLQLALMTYTKKETLRVSFFIFRSDWLLSSSHGATLLLDAGSLTCEFAQIVQLSAANLTNLVDLDRIDGR